ncbi:MAG: hypothetical protein R2849_07975 [Thermomicrobiales bacterium]
MSRRIATLVLCAGFLVLLAACSSPNRDEFRTTPAATVEVPTSTPTVSPTATATRTPAPTSTPTVTPSPTPSPTATATPEPTATATPEPPALAIANLALNDIDGSPLQFLSIDEHPLFGGSTLVHGTIAIEGEGEVSSVSLEITDEANGAVIEVDMTGDAGEQLLLPLGESGRVEIAESQLLFEIPSTAFADFDRTSDGYVDLQVSVTTTDGRRAVSGGSGQTRVQKLVRYTADNRYFVGEEEQGGNSWVTPSVKALTEQLADVQFGDFSNMNGGYFPPHVSHQRGVDVDAWFFGYNALDGDAARFMLDLLNQPGIIERVELVYVAYTQADGDPFWDAIRDVVLIDGRSAGEVFVPDAEHDAHCHVRFWE